MCVLVGFRVSVSFLSSFFSFFLDAGLRIF